MEVYCRGVAQIRHASTCEVFEIESDELDWDAVGGDERQMGSEIHYEATVVHPELGNLTWGLWEYPLGIENYNITDVGKHEVIEDFDYGLEHEEPDADYWLDYESSPNPYRVFLSSYHHTGLLLSQHGSMLGDNLFNRMIFSQQITALEAYLGDTLLNDVMNDKKAMQRLIDNDDDLAKEKYTLSEVSKDPGLIESKVRAHLREVLYHNLAKVDVLYNIALGVRILDLTADRKRLFKAVLLRHDCVHRNGFDKDGNEINIFTKVFVQDTADLIKTFVDGIQQAVHRRAA